MTCSICRHSHRTDIETALLKGRPLRDIESQWGVSRSALSRHQEAGHVAASVRCAHRAGEADRGQTLLDQVDELKNRVSAVLDRAEAENNARLALMAARELRGCLDLLGRVMGELNPGTTTVNVLLSPQWLQIRSMLFSALDVYPEARIAVVRAFPTFAEMELDGAYVEEVTPPPHGLRIMMEAIEYSRIHNALSGAAVQRRAVLEAVCWASDRRGFDATISAFPMVRDELLDMITDAEAGAAIAFEAARSFDLALINGRHRPWLRLATALAKYWTAKQAVRAAVRAVERSGGNGYTEEYPTARLFRDSLVLAVWEGPANIQALELIRLAIGSLPGDQAFLDRLRTIQAALPEPLQEAIAILDGALERCRRALTYLRQNPAEGPRHSRRLLELMANTLCSGLLCEEAAADLAQGDARKSFVAKRFLASTFGGCPSIGPDADPAQTYFEAIIGHDWIAA